MFFRSRLSLKTLSGLCRSLGTLLHSGVDIKQSMDLVARKTGDTRCRQTLSEMGVAIRSGSEISAAMRAYGDYFPELLVNMVGMAEQTGELPEVLLHLAEHYEQNLELRRTFLRSIAWPVFQLVAAILVIALLILLLGVIAQVQGGEALDVLGLGLSGPSGAAVWLTGTFGSMFLLFLAFQVANRSLSGKRWLDPLLMKVPVLGSCLRSFAIARFSWAYYLTQQTGMPIRRSLKSSLNATSNGAFIRAIPQICHQIEAGGDLSTALTESRLFPEEYLQVVQVGETSGTVPEALHRLSPQFLEDARRRLRTLGSAAGWLVWLTVAGFIVFFIFRVVFWYVGMLSDVLKET